MGMEQYHFKNHFLVTKSLHTKFGKNGTVISGKSYVNDFGPRSRNDLDIEF